MPPSAPQRVGMLAGIRSGVLPPTASLSSPVNVNSPHDLRLARAGGLETDATVLTRLAQILPLHPKRDARHAGLGQLRNRDAQSQQNP